MRMFLVIALVSIAIPAGAFAQDGPDSAAGAADVAPGDLMVADELAPTADVVSTTVNVHVRGLPEGPVLREIRLHVVVPPHQVLDTRTAALDADGRATLEVNAAPGTEVVAELQGDRRTFSDPVAITPGGEHDVVIEMPAQTSDPGDLYATSVHTILELWEGYVTVTQAWNLDVRGGAQFASARMPDGRPDFATLVRFPLPDEADGINVIRPEGTARVTGTVVSASLVVDPRDGDAQRGADVVIQYSIPSHAMATVEWTQLLSMDVEAFNVIVPQSSMHARHPTLDVEIAETGCNDASRVCLALTEDRHHLPIQPDLDIRVATGSGTAGQTVEISTSGWPSRSRLDENAAKVLGGLAVVFVALLFLRDRRTRPEDPTALRAASLRAARESLFEAARELDRQLDDGIIIESDHALQMERIRQQLGVVFRRLRELDEASEARAGK